MSQLWAEEPLKALIQGNVPIFSQLLQSFILSSMSTFDIPSTEPERSYHLFVLGLVMVLKEYEVKSNRESGLGRYDIMLIPRQPQQTAVIIEFKKVWDDKNDSLEKAAQKALNQIMQKKYIEELKNHNAASIIAYGIACKGKNIFVASKSLISEDNV